MKIIDRNNPIDQEDGWLLLEEITINDRALICWYSPESDEIDISIFHLLERPNELSRRSKESRWGFMTYFVQGIRSDLQATEIINLYLRDIKAGNYWWENSPNH